MFHLMARRLFPRRRGPRFSASSEKATTVRHSGTCIERSKKKTEAERPPFSNLPQLVAQALAKSRLREPRAFRLPAQLSCLSLDLRSLRLSCPREDLARPRTES